MKNNKKNCMIKYFRRYLKYNKSAALIIFMQILTSFKQKKNKIYLI